MESARVERTLGVAQEGLAADMVRCDRLLLEGGDGGVPWRLPDEAAAS